MARELLFGDAVYGVLLRELDLNSDARSRLRPINFHKVAIWD